METGKTESEGLKLLWAAERKENGRWRHNVLVIWDGRSRLCLRLFQALNHNEADRSTDKRWKTCRVLLNDGSITTRMRVWPTHPSSCHQLEQGWLIFWAEWKWSSAIGCWWKTMSPGWRATSEVSGCCTPSVRGSLQWQGGRKVWSQTRCLRL